MMQLPYLADQFLLRPGITFLNHGSFGACPKPVFDTYQQWQRELEAQPVELLGRRISLLLAEARAALAGYIGADAGEVVFLPNVTYAINIVARSLDLQPGDEVVATDHEYGAVDRTWQFVCEARGAKYIRTPLPMPLTDQTEIVEAVWSAVTPRTKVIAISHITSPTAMIFPVAELCRRAREHGIITVIDGAHAPGQIDLDMHAIGADFYGGNCHKWLCAPKGAGMLYARAEMQHLLQPLIVSWGWRSITPGESPFLDLFEWLGTDDPSAFLSVPAAIAFQREHNWPAVRAACHDLAVHTRRRIGAWSGLPQICPEAPEWFAQMCLAPLPQTLPALELKARMWDEYQVEAPLIQWGDQLFIRVSHQCYNGPADIDRLMVALQELLG